MNKILSSVAAAAVVTFGAAAQAATVQIDSFNDNQAPVVAAGGATVSDTVATTNAIGGSRTIEVENVSGPFSTAGATSSMMGGQFFFSNDAGTQGNAELQYTGLGGVDFTDSGSNSLFLMEVVAIDLGMEVGITVDGVTVSQIVMSQGNIAFNFADFGGADLTSVNDLIVSFDSNGIDSVDAIVDFIGAVNPVPLPAGGLLLLTALGGIAVARRKSA
ncbi:VPLPA-CTERM sorting domain-containing protein [Primorskyibacter sp. S187A]|uniref:VPLPA-CTERM sorting domain-containing protein n=1 Tax=Primorskyibacter sp. S187A TaxID=3415130 RepID=UPI003C7A3E7D